MARKRPRPEDVDTVAFDISADAIYVCEPPSSDWTTTEGFTKLTLTIEGLVATKEYDNESRELDATFKKVCFDGDFDMHKIIDVRMEGGPTLDAGTIPLEKLVNIIGDMPFEHALEAIDVEHTTRYTVQPTLSIDHVSSKTKVLFEYDAHAIVNLFVKTNVFHSLEFI